MAIITNPIRKSKDSTGGGNSTNNVTIITYINNYSGDVINSPIIINNVMNIQVIEGGMTLTIIQDFDIINNEIHLHQTVENLNMTIIYYNVNQTVIENKVKGGFKNTEDAKAGGLKAGEMYYLLNDNDSAMYSGVVVYIAQ